MSTGGFFSRSKSGPADSGPPPRDIEPLFPTFYQKALVDGGKPVTDSNIVAVANLTTANLALNAHRWLEAIGSSQDKVRWSQAFGQDDADLDQLVRRSDRMIDFLWAWSPRVHPGLRDFIQNMHGTITSSTQRYGNELPFDMWGAEQ